MNDNFFANTKDFTTVGELLNFKLNINLNCDTNLHFKMFDVDYFDGIHLTSYTSKFETAEYGEDLKDDYLKTLNNILDFLNRDTCKFEKNSEHYDKLDSDISSDITKCLDFENTLDKFENNYPPIDKLLSRKPITYVSCHKFRDVAEDIVRRFCEMKNTYPIPSMDEKDMSDDDKMLLNRYVLSYSIKYDNKKLDNFRDEHWGQKFYRLYDFIFFRMKVISQMEKEIECVL